MKQRMNVMMFLSRGVAAGRNPVEGEDGRENYPASFWAHIDGVDGPIEPSTATVSFERRHNGGEFSLRVVKLEGVQAGLDDRLPTLVLCAAGKNHWFRDEVSEDVVQFGRPELRYGSAVILSPGEMATSAMYRRAPRRARVLGAWHVQGAAGVMYVTTSPDDADLGEPMFESVAVERPATRPDLEDESPEQAEEHHQLDNAAPF